MLKTLLLVLALLLPSISAAPDETSGIVTRIIDGDTIEVQDIGRIRLADIDCPEIARPGGQEAADYTRSWLQSNLVYLDIDDKSVFDNTGDERYVCVVYLANPDGSLNASRNFNRMLVESGHAYIQDYPSNEFDPKDWWGGHIPAGIKNESITGAPGNSTVPGIVAPFNKTLIGSTLSRKYHNPSCRWAKRIHPEYEKWFSSADEARSEGYVGCKVCNPE